MVEQIEKIRLMMAEQRYIEAQQLVEQTMLMHKSDQLLGLYIEIHLLQDIALPYSETVQYIRTIQQTDPHESLRLIHKLNSKHVEVRLIELELYARLGSLNELYNCLSDFYVYLYERKIPRTFPEIYAIRKKFFATDFKLELQELALEADRGWSAELENHILEMIKECFQSYSIKNKHEKLVQLHRVIDGFQFNGSSKLISTLLALYIEGVKESKDYKKLIELVINFDDLPMKAIVLNLLDKLELDDVASTYAQVLKNQPGYSFVHFEKYYPHLKKYFVAVRKEKEFSDHQLEKIDLTLEGFSSDLNDDVQVTDDKDSDLDITESLKHMEYDLTGWLNLAVGFIQSDFPKAAFFCAQKVREQSTNDEDFLKGSYLATHALIKSHDYRLALDYCYEALERSQLETDVLSFSYMEAELLIQLGEKKAAQIVISQIQKIDSSYRLSSKMQKRLDEI